MLISKEAIIEKLQKLNPEEMIDIGSVDYDDPHYRPVEDWFFEPATAIGLVQDEDYLILYNSYHLRPYDKTPLTTIDTIFVTKEAACLMEDYYDQKSQHYNRLANEIKEYGRMPIDDAFIYQRES